MGRSGSGVEVRPRSIRLAFTVDGVNHRETLRLNGKPMAPTQANIKYAHRVAAEIRAKIAVGAFALAEYFPASGMGSPSTVAAQLDTWLGTQGRREASTLAAYGSAAKFWKATIGSRPLRALKPGDIMTAISSRPLLTGKTVNNYVSVLREALALAVLDGLIGENPASTIARSKHQKPPPDPFTREEAEAIVADMAAHYPAQIANYVEAKFFTGLRTSESFGLRWDNVDLAGAHMVVSEATVRGVHKARTKTNRARTVLLNSRALAAITRQRAHTLMAASGAVFQDPRYDEPWFEERAFRRSYWEPCLRRLKMRYRPPYNTRHTYATMMLMAGMTPAFCAEQMGHSVEMFLRTYAKWLGGAQNAVEMGRLEAALGAGISPESPQKSKTPGVYRAS